MRAVRGRGNSAVPCEDAEGVLAINRRKYSFCHPGESRDPFLHLAYGSRIKSGMTKMNRVPLILFVVPEDPGLDPGDVRDLVSLRDILGV